MFPFYFYSDLNNMALCYKMSKITSPVQREEVQGSSPPINMYVLFEVYSSTYVYCINSVKPVPHQECSMHLLHTICRINSTSTSGVWHAFIAWNLQYQYQFHHIHIRGATYVYCINSVESVSNQFIVQVCMSRAWRFFKVKLDTLVPLEFLKHLPIIYFHPIIYLEYVNYTHSYIWST